MSGPNSAISSVDGSLSWEGGVDSIKVPTIQSAQNPNGLARSEIAWLTNGTVRDSGITPRAGWKLNTGVADGTSAYQGGYMYQPPTGDPYLVCAIGGHIFKVVPGQAPIDLSLGSYSLGGNPSPAPMVFLVNVDGGPIGNLEAAGNVSPIGNFGAFIIPPVGVQVGAVVPSTYIGPTGITVEIGLSDKHIWHIQSQTHRWYIPQWVGGIGGSFIYGSSHFVDSVAQPDNVPNPYGLPAVGIPATNPFPGNPNFPVVDGPVIEVGTITQVTQPDLIFVENLSNYTPSNGHTREEELPGITNWIDANIVTDIGQAPGHYIVFGGTPFGGLLPNPVLTNNASIPQFYFCQAEQWLIIQAGDLVTLPLFWDGAILRRSKGITNKAVAPGSPGVNEIPAAGPMDYYMGRLWYAQGRQYSAGDIVGGPSGTLAYKFLDSVLNVTENPLVLGGDGFTVPNQEGDITALKHNAAIDVAMGQGRLFVFTEKAIYSLSVPVTRDNWIAANNSNQPLQTVVQLTNGAAGDRSVVAINGDLFYQSIEPSVRSLITAVRNFTQWANVPISAKMERLFKFTDRSLMRYGSGILFDNRLIQTALPVSTPQGVIHQALMALDFTPLSEFGSDLNPIWEGMYDGLDHLQMFTGIFNGEERAFTFIVSRTDRSIQLWEMTKDERFDQNDARIQMVVEFPAFTWGQEFELKKQISAEMWIDRLYGEVIFTLEYRPDGETCWQKWHEWKVCSPRNSCENAGKDPCTGLERVQCYPLIQYGESYVQTMTLPKPPIDCSKTSGRPSNINYQFQPRLTMRGFARVRGFLIQAEKVDRKLYSNMICS